MCQVSIYVCQGSSEELVKENITQLELIEGGVRVKTLFEGDCELGKTTLKHIDFSAGKIVLEKQE